MSCFLDRCFCVVTYQYRLALGRADAHPPVDGGLRVPPRRGDSARFSKKAISPISTARDAEPLVVQLVLEGREKLASFLLGVGWVDRWVGHRSLLPSRLSVFSDVLRQAVTRSDSYGGPFPSGPPLSSCKTKSTDDTPRVSGSPSRMYSWSFIRSVQDASDSSLLPRTSRDRSWLLP